MVSCLPYVKDQNDIKEIFDVFVNEKNVFMNAIKMIENKPEEQRSLAENFACAYSAESLRNYTLAIKSYLMLSRQYYKNTDIALSIFCIKKAEFIVKEAMQTGDFDIASLLEKIGVDWLS